MSEKKLLFLSQIRDTVKPQLEKEQYMALELSNEVFWYHSHNVSKVLVSQDQLTLQKMTKYKTNTN